MTPLRSTLKELADTFASTVLTALRGASLDELLAESTASESPRTAAPPKTSAATGRLRRRSAADLEAAVVAVVAALKVAKSGLRAEALREKMGLARKELPRVLQKALGEKRIRKTGAKRATTYFVRESSSSPSPRPARSERKHASKNRSKNHAFRRPSPKKPTQPKKRKAPRVARPKKVATPPAASKLAEVPKGAG